MILPIYVLLLSAVRLASAASTNLSLDSDVLLRLKATYYNTASESGDDVLSQTKARAEGLIDILEAFADDPRAVEFVAKNFGGSPCINSLDDAISATRSLVDMIKKSSPEITSITNTFSELKNERNTVKLMRGSAQMMSDLDTLMPRWANFPLTTQCRVSPQESLEGMQDLANLIYKMSRNPEHSLEVRDYLKRSWNSIDASTTFVGNLGKIHKNFPDFCSSDPRYTDKAVEAIGDLFDEATLLLKALGRNFDLREYKQKNMKYAAEIVNTFEQLEELDLGFFDCTNNFFSMRLAAETLNELADIVEEIGVDQLSQSLGIRFNLAFPSVGV